MLAEFSTKLSASEHSANGNEVAWSSSLPNYAPSAIFSNYFCR